MSGCTPEAPSASGFPGRQVGADLRLQLIPKGGCPQASPLSGHWSRAVGDMGPARWTCPRCGGCRGKLSWFSEKCSNRGKKETNRQPDKVEARLHPAHALPVLPSTEPGGEAKAGCGAAAGHPPELLSAWGSISASQNHHNVVPEELVFSLSDSTRNAAGAQGKPSQSCHLGSFKLDLVCMLLPPPKTPTGPHYFTVLPTKPFCGNVTDQHHRP